MANDDPTPGYAVIVADNFHYMDEDEQYQLGVFATLEEALEACRSVVERSLKNVYKVGMSADDLLDRYRSFGDDPFVRGAPGAAAPRFSAWDYAREQAETICAGSREADAKPA